MAEMVLAAKVTHLPTRIMSEPPGRLSGTRRQAIDARRRIGGRARALGAAIRAAIGSSDARVLLLASGSLPHRIRKNEPYAANNGTFAIGCEVNRRFDLMALQLWQEGDIATVLKMLPDHARQGCGEGSMHHTAMRFGATGRDGYRGPGKGIGENFSGSGTGQANVVFPVH